MFLLFSNLEIDAEELEIAFEIALEFANEYLATNPTTVLTLKDVVILRIYTYEMMVGKPAYAAMNAALRSRGAERIARLARFKKYIWMLLRADSLENRGAQERRNFRQKNCYIQKIRGGISMGTKISEQRKP